MTGRGGTTRGGTSRGSAGQRKLTKVRRGKPQAAPRRRSHVRAPLMARVLARLPIAPDTLRRIVTGAALAGAAALAWTAGAYSGVNAWVGAEVAQAIGRAGFEVKRVEVVGANHIDRLHVYDIVLRERNRSMAAVDLDEVREGLLAYGWVADARVTRRLPDTLHVELVERTPVAVWQRGGQLSLIDESGTVLDDADTAAMAGLPIIVGRGAARQMRQLGALIDAAPALRPQIVGASWVGNRRWDLRFRSGELLMLPEGDVAATAAFVDFARMDGINRLLGRSFVRFDMRDPARLTMRRARAGQLREGQAAAASDVQRIAPLRGGDAPAQGDTQSGG